MAVAGCWWSARWRGGNPYVTYARDGITREELLAHLGHIRESILLFSPSAHFEPLRLLSARGVEDAEELV